ncbi:LysR family transcriptional regulator [Roseovarius halotolerans]|uniref:LysR family transcriptional regulator n=1 Tax=Roseovarius halotolerans TaxID=505353 RepID=UPI001FE46F49|nr:LysR family transcriptional regulator [Roseovarius halotolerans]
MNINIRHLRAMVAVQAHGSFVRAASALGIVPSALSETIQQLEEAVGSPLFDRSQRPPAPTPTALTFLQEAAPLLDGLDRAITRLQTRGVQGAGTLNVGCSPSAISELVAPALSRFRGLYPEVRLRIHDDIAETLARMVVDGKLDLAVAGRALHSPDLKQEEIIRDPVGLACATGHALAGCTGLTLKDIDPGEVISLSPGTGTHQLLASSAHVPPVLRMGAIEAHSTIAQLAMIRAGLGVGLLPRNAVMLFGDPRLTFVPVADLDLWRTLFLLLPTQRKLTSMTRVFVETLRQ